jgi:hypothetical protein
MTVAQQRRMARLERLAKRTLDSKSKQPEDRTSKQPDDRSPIEKELTGMDLFRLNHDELSELGEFLEMARDLAGGSSALPTASRERFRELIAKANPNR